MLRIVSLYSHWALVEMQVWFLSVLPSHPTQLKSTIKQSPTVLTGSRLQTDKAAHQAKDVLVPNPEL